MHHSISRGFYRQASKIRLQRSVNIYRWRAYTFFRSSKAPVESFLALTWLMEPVFSPGVARRNVPSPRQAIAAAAQRHLELRGSAYGSDAFQQKNHQELHIAADVDRCQVNCFVRERKNKRYKRIVQHTYSAETREWSRPISRAMLLEQVAFVSDVQ